jgi:aryl-alcohol dehydrogenase-like predicted oxidoreductase
MQTRRLGRQGPEITVLGLGSWVFSGAGGLGLGPADDVESIDTIRRAMDRGINWIDTAPIYGFGHAEEVVGRALRDRKIGEDVYVFTKCGMTWPATGALDLTSVARDLRPASIRRECEQSLRRLRVERIDLYQCHWPDDSTGTPVEESWSVMAELVDEGKVRWAGLSNFDVALLERCSAIRHVDSLQVPLNLINRAALARVIPWCASHGTGVITYGPLGTGLLTGAVDRRRISNFSMDDRRRSLPRFQEPQLSANLALVDALASTAACARAGLPALAVAWVLSRPGVTAVIAGARRAQQMDGWLPAAGVVLGDRDVAEIDGAIQRSGV